MITALYLPLAPLKEYLNGTETDELVRDIKGTPYVQILTDSTEQRICDDVQMIRVKTIKNPYES